MTAYPEIDYLAIGHAALDQTPLGYVPGGTVTFAARVAQALGCRAAVVTSASTELELEAVFPGILVKNIPSEKSTAFHNIYERGQRRQQILSTASPIKGSDVPELWRRAPIVHIGPIANEIDPTTSSVFSNSLVGITPQGWFRRWDAAGQVYCVDWLAPQETLSTAAAVILSLEDLGSPETIRFYRRFSRLLVLTEQAGGCRVYCQGEERHFPAPSVREINPTGAGDTFAAAFLIRLHQTRGNPWEAAEFANQVAAVSVTQQTLDEKIAAISELVTASSESVTLDD